MGVRVRFAPSPTGQVHIGNIRAAIFNWLYARHEEGTFLLRVEDTDLERSTPQAIAALLDVMEWLGLNFDEEIFYQTTQSAKHIAAAQDMLAKGLAYEDKKGGDKPAMLFRFPYDCDSIPGVEAAGEITANLHDSVPLTISLKGLDFATVSPKGRPAPGGATLAGFKDLKVFDEAGNLIFDLSAKLDAVLAGEVFTLPEARKITYTRRTISYEDMVKGTMTKPLDAMKDFVIVRSDGSPVFHLANVIDDITQGVTHIIRGDDHVENTFKHLFLFHALGEKAPAYAHLPMIVNAQGKPYSKRDGDAFVGDFREKGFLPAALFNYMSLLGWSPGDDREKMDRQELVSAFSLERCLRAPAQMDSQKLTNLNGQYIAELPIAEFVSAAKNEVAKYSWGAGIADNFFLKVCAFMQSRCKRLVDVAQWEYFFTEEPTWNEAVCDKLLKDPKAISALKTMADDLEALPEFTAAAIENVVAAAAEAAGFGHGKLNQPLRAAVTGTNIGAGVFETLELIGKCRTVQRIRKATANR